jgi:hypothetical protein
MDSRSLRAYKDYRWIVMDPAMLGVSRRFESEPPAGSCHLDGLASSCRDLVQP